MYDNGRKVYKYASINDIFHRCEHKTFDDNDTKEDKTQYVRKTERSDHKYAFTRKKMIKVVDVVFETLFNSLIQGHTVSTPLGVMSIRKFRCDIKEVGGKIYKQLNMLNYRIRLFCVGNRYHGRNYTKVLFNSKALKDKIYPTIIEDTSLLYNYNTESSYTRKKNY